MATLEDAARIDALLRPLAALLNGAVEKERRWVEAILDVRYCDADGSFIDKARVRRADGRIDGLKLPIDTTHLLIALNEARPTDTDRWYGVTIRVTPDRKCETRFEYDPACFDDPAFYES